MISRVSGTNKEKQPKRQNRTKKQRLNRKKKNDTKKQKIASPGVEPGSSAGASTSLAPQCHTHTHVLKH